MKNLDDLNLTSQERKAINDASALLKERFPVEKVIIFGSKARGDDEPDSDIDMLLLTSKPLHWKERDSIIDALFDVQMTYDVLISILDTTVSDWQDGIFTIFPIYDEIKRDGAIAA